MGRMNADYILSGVVRLLRRSAPRKDRTEYITSLDFVEACYIHMSLRAPMKSGRSNLTHSPCNSSEILPFDRLRACPVLDTCEQIGRSLLHAISTGVGNDESAYCILKVIWNSSGIVSKLMKCCRRLAPGQPVSLKLKLKHACSNTGIMN